MPGVWEPEEREHSKNGVPSASLGHTPTGGEVMMNRAILLTVMSCLLLGATAESARGALITVPVGVQNDIAYSTVTTTWGWTQLYRGDYNASGVNLTSILSGAQDYLMLGAIHKTTNVIRVLAASQTPDVTTYTPQSLLPDGLGRFYTTTHLSNQVRWYFNSGSMGFASSSDDVVQNSTDVADDTGGGIFENDR